MDSELVSALGKQNSMNVCLFKAHWCGACQKMCAEGGPWKQASAELRDHHHYNPIECETNSDTDNWRKWRSVFEKSETNGIPCIIFCDDDQVPYGKSVGVVPAEIIVVRGKLAAVRQLMAMNRELAAIAEKADAERMGNEHQILQALLTALEEQERGSAGPGRSLS